jgi:hypothetical protein
VPGGPDRDGARFVLLVAAAGLIAVLWPVWAVVGAVGLATTSQEQADAAFAALLETERSGWGVLGAWAAAPLAAAVACVAVAVPVASARRRTLVAAAVLAGLAAVVVALAGFSPGSAVTPPAARAAGLPAGVPLDPTWAPEGALLALALALAALGMTLARRAWPPGSANVLGGCVLLAQSGGEKNVQLPFAADLPENRRHPLHVLVHTGEAGQHVSIGVFATPSDPCFSSDKYLNKR